jgi:hypothetical protein
MPPLPRVAPSPAPPAQLQPLEPPSGVARFVTLLSYANLTRSLWRTLGKHDFCFTRLKNGRASAAFDSLLPPWLLYAPFLTVSATMIIAREIHCSPVVYR